MVAVRKRGGKAGKCAIHVAMVALAAVPVQMSVDEFLAWAPGAGERWQLVDGVPNAMAPASLTHGALQPEMARLMGHHLRASGSRCRVITAPGGGRGLAMTVILK
jgi:Uma2 family endonuclease